MEDLPAPDWRDAAAREYHERREELLRQHVKGSKAITRMQRRLSEIEEGLSDLDRGAKAFGLVIPDGSTLPPIRATANITLAPVVGSGRGHHQPPQFKDLALEYLAQAYPSPRKAGEVQAHVEGILGREFHWKTSGMTLYRLSKETKVQRVGQSWFYVPEESREALRAAEEAEAAGEVYDDLSSLADRTGEAAEDFADLERQREKYEELRYDPGEQGPEEEGV